MTLPAPLTPADCDLRGYDFMPLFGHRLFGSVFDARATDAEFRAAVRLWWQAWQQCPAGSLPNDDGALAKLADFGRDVKGWLKVKGNALHGFVLCSDGRLYHHLLCEQALEAYERRGSERDRKAKWRAAKAAKAAQAQRDNEGTGQERPEDVPVLSRGTTTGRPADVPADRTEQDRTEEKEPSLRSGHAGGAPLSVEEAAPPHVDARAYLWREGRAAFSRLTGKPEKQAGRMLGRWLQQAGDDCTVVTQVLADAEGHRPVDPIAWIEAAIAHRMGRRPGAQPEFRNGFLQNLADQRGEAPEPENPLLSNRFLPGSERRRAR
ncbi:hypothetical protein [Roseomonas elaeocarpi]|uniref:DUF1376 domain-containing protein n=1 Tax=Roseomonas elaeocarpi TaxID=907779 RepID=A0ABV6JZA3_9PROT